MIDPHIQKLFSLGLGLEEPWRITSLEMVPSEKQPTLLELHIRIDFKEGSSFQYPGFDQSCKVHDTRERTWRHLNFFQYRCYITAKVPRIITPDGKVRTVSVPWARSGSGFTLMMEGVILTLVKHMPVRTVAREIGEHDTKLWRLIDYHTEEALKDQDLWLKNPDKQRTRLSQLLEVEYLDTVQAYSCRLELQDFYETHKAYDEEMVSAFEGMVIKFANSPVKEIRKFAACLTRNAVEILKYFQTLRTNAILEGFNSKISIIKSRARGFKNMRNFMNMIYFVCGELSLPLQPIM